MGQLASSPVLPGPVRALAVGGHSTRGLMYKRGPSHSQVVLQSSYVRATAVILVAAPLIHIVDVKDVCNEVVVIIVLLIDKVNFIIHIHHKVRFIP